MPRPGPAPQTGEHHARSGISHTELLGYRVTCAALSTSSPTEQQTDLPHRQLFARFLPPGLAEQDMTSVTRPASSGTCFAGRCRCRRTGLFPITPEACYSNTNCAIAGCHLISTHPRPTKSTSTAIRTAKTTAPPRTLTARTTVWALMKRHPAGERPTGGNTSTAASGNSEPKSESSPG